MISEPLETEIEVKNIVDAVVNQLVKIFDHQRFGIMTRQMLQSEYDKGLDIVGKQLGQNFTRNTKELDFLQKYAQGNIGDTFDKINKDLRGEIERAIMDKKTVNQIKKDIKQKFKDKKYMQRLKAVLRTEAERAGNYGRLQGATQSTIVRKKYLRVILDQVTSNICREEDKKYGSPDTQAIDLDALFVVRADNKTISRQAPPFHVNCRTLIAFKELETTQ